MQTQKNDFAERFKISVRFRLEK